MKTSPLEVDGDDSSDISTDNPGNLDGDQVAKKPKRKSRESDKKKKGNDDDTVLSAKRKNSAKKPAP